MGLGPDLGLLRDHGERGVLQARGHVWVDAVVERDRERVVLALGAEDVHLPGQGSP